MAQQTQKANSQIIIGDDNKRFNLHLESGKGDAISHMAPDLSLRFRAKDTPIFIHPKRFPNLLNRRNEVDFATHQLKLGQSVEIYGQPGLGKTALLRHLAHQPFISTFEDGLIKLPQRSHVGDMLQFLFKTFYETSLPFIHTKPQSYLQNKKALILLDNDVTLDQTDVDGLIQTLSNATFLVASPKRRLWGEGRTIGLRGLALSDSLKLMERELERNLTPREGPAAETLWELLQGHPLQMVQAASIAKSKGISLAALVNKEEDAETAQKRFLNLALTSLSKPDRQVLVWLAALGGQALTVHHLTELVGVSQFHLTSTLELLRQQGLVQLEGKTQYSIKKGVIDGLAELEDVAQWTAQALNYFSTSVSQAKYVSATLLTDIEAVLYLLEWAINNKRWVEALVLGKGIENALALGGYIETRTQVLEWGLQAAQSIGNDLATARALHQLGSWLLCLGSADKAEAHLNRALEIREHFGDKAGAKITRHNLKFLSNTPPPPPMPTKAIKAPASARPSPQPISKQAPQPTTRRTLSPVGKLTIGLISAGTLGCIALLVLSLLLGIAFVAAGILPSPLDTFETDQQTSLTITPNVALLPETPTVTATPLIGPSATLIISPIITQTPTLDLPTFPSATPTQARNTPTARPTNTNTPLATPTNTASVTNTPETTISGTATATQSGSAIFPTAEISATATTTTPEIPEIPRNSPIATPKASATITSTTPASNTTSHSSDTGEEASISLAQFMPDIPNISIPSLPQIKALHVSYVDNGEAAAILLGWKVDNKPDIEPFLTIGEGNEDMKENSYIWYPLEDYQKVLTEISGNWLKLLQSGPIPAIMLLAIACGLIGFALFLLPIIIVNKIRRLIFRIVFLPFTLLKKLVRVVSPI